MYIIFCVQHSKPLNKELPFSCNSRELHILEQKISSVDFIVRVRLRLRIFVNFMSCCKF